MKVSIEAPAVHGVQLIYITTEFLGCGFIYINVNGINVNKEWTDELNRDYTGDLISPGHANRVLNAWVLEGYPRGEF